MSIFTRKSVRSVIAIAFTLSAMFAWTHQHAQTTQKQLAANDGAGYPCVWANGGWVCP